MEKTAEPEENIRYLVGYNGDVWSREDDFAEDSAEDYSLPVLRRLEDCETSIWITAEINLAEPDSEKPSWSYAADRSYTFDSVHCEVDLEYSYGERENCTLFYGERGEALTLTLNKDGLNGLTKYDTQWIVTQYCDGEERDVTAVNYDDQDNDQITLVPTADFPEDGSWIHVEAKIMVQENERQILVWRRQNAIFRIPFLATAYSCRTGAMTLTENAGFMYGISDIPKE